MKRVNLNFVVDGAAMFLLLLLLSTGLLITFRLPPGSGGHLPFGRGLGALDRPIDVVGGLTRHDWGEIHLWIACAFLAVLVFHLALHWKWIVAMFKNLASSCSKLQFLVVLVVVAISLALVTYPWLAPLQQTTQREQQELQQVSANNTP